MTVDTTKPNLQKGDVVNLNQEAGKVLSKLNIGLGWDFNSNNRIDLDASAILYNAGNTKIGHVFFNEKSAFDGGVALSGDNTTGEGDGDDETIYVDFAKLPAEVDKVLITITNYTEQPLSVVKNAFARAVDPETNNELAKYELTNFGGHTALYMALLQRTEGGFTLKAIGEPANGKTFADLVPGAAQFL